MALVIIVLCGLGCSNRQPKVTRAGDVLEQTIAKTTKVPSDWKTLSKEAGPVDDNWVAAFGDKELLAMVDETLKNNLSLKTAAANVDLAAAQAIIAGASLKPMFGISGGADRIDGTNTVRAKDIVGVVSWEMDLWDKLNSAAKAGKLAYAATVEDFRAAQQSLAAQVSTTWFLVTQITQQRSLLDDSIKLLEEMKKIAQTRYEVGIVSESDAVLAAADIATTKEKRFNLQATLELSERSLEVLLGRYPSAEIAVVDRFSSLPPAIPVDVPSALLERRPDLVAAQQRIAATSESVEEARGARLPSFSLTAGGGHSSKDLKSLLGVDNKFYKVGINFVAPISTGGALEAQIDISKSRYNAALTAYGQQALLAFKEVEQYLSQEQILGEREELLKVASQQNERALDLGRKQYDVGQIDMMSILQMQGRLLKANSTLVAIRYDRLANRVALHLALGGSFVASETR